MILLIGATGTVGSEVTKQLAQSGAQFRILARNPEKAAKIVGPDVQIAHGELENIPSVEAALKGIDHLFLLTPSGPEQVKIESNVVDAAARAGISHIVKLSVLGAGPFSPIGVNRWHWLSEKHIEQTGVPFTAVRPGFFMQNTLMFAGTAVSEGKIYAPAADAKVSVVDARDIAAVAVAALTKEGHIGKAYDVTGPQAVSFEEIAQSISAAINKTVTYVSVPPEAARKAMLDSGTPEWLTDDLLKYYEYFRAGHGSVVTPVVERIKGKSGITYAQFARDYADTFSGAA